MTKGAVLILGARSDIARAVAHRFASLGHPVQLAARQSIGLENDRADLELRYRVPVTLHEFDALNEDSHAQFVEMLNVLPAIVICAVGFLGEQTHSENDPAAANRVLRTNFLGPASVLAHLANRFVQRGSGTLVGISSVAGERGRASNYVYGSSKAGFTAFLSGLRNRLAHQGVHVVTVMPGFVATQMTEGMTLPKRLTAQPDEVAMAIERAVTKRRNVIYVRPVWQAIMFAIRAIPEGIFKRMRL